MQRQPAENIPKSWRRRLCRLLLGALVFCFVGFVLINIVLNSPLVRGKIEKKLEEKTGLAWDVAVIRWTPFTGLSAQEISSKLGEEGVVSVEHVQITPYWTNCISGDFQIREIEATNTLIDVEKSWLIDHLTKREAAKKTELSPSVPKPPKPPANPQPKPPVKPDPKPPVTPKPPVKPKPQPKPKPPVEPDYGLEKFLKLKNARLIIRDGEEVAYDSEAVDMLIPFSGDETEGFIKSLKDDTETPIHWNGEALQVEKKEVEFYGYRGLLEGLKLDVRASLYPKKSQIFHVVAALPSVSYERKLDSASLKAEVTAARFGGAFECKGSLINPQTWKGGVRFSGEEVRLNEKLKHHELDFDTVQLNARILGPNIIVDNAEARGHELVIFGNGVVQRNLTGYGVMRMIANPFKRQTIEKTFRGAHLNFHLTEDSRYMFTPLNNEDYFMTDLYFTGKVFDPLIRHERGEAWVSFREILIQLIRFKDDELREDGLIP